MMNNFSLSDLRTIVTSLSFVVFIAIVWWAYGARQKQRFEEAANLPFADAELPNEITIQHATVARANRTVNHGEAK
jgi:cytochrome c oxidase cbb3-type subunit IV